MRERELRDQNWCTFMHVLYTIHTRFIYVSYTYYTWFIRVLYTYYIHVLYTHYTRFKHVSYAVNQIIDIVHLGPQQRIQLGPLLQGGERFNDGTVREPRRVDKAVHDKGRKEGKKERRKEGRKEGREEGKKDRGSNMAVLTSRMRFEKRV